MDHSKPFHINQPMKWRLFFFLLRVNQIPEKNSTFLCNSGRRRTWGCHPTARRNIGTTVIRSIAVSRSVSDILRWFQGYRVLWVVRGVRQSSRDLAEVREANWRYSYCRMRKFWYIHRRLAFSLGSDLFMKLYRCDGRALQRWYVCRKEEWRRNAP